MIPSTCSTHQTYLAHLARYAVIHAGNLHVRQILKQAEAFVVVLVSLSLDVIRDDLIALYCPSGQGNPWDPMAMFRSLLLLTLTKEGSITQWVTTTRENPVLAVLAGFDPRHTPGVGTYYDFMARFIDGPYDLRHTQEMLLSTYLRGRHTRSLTDRTDARREDAAAFATQSAKTVHDLLAAADVPRDPFALATRLENLHAALGLEPTLASGLFRLIGVKLVIAGDGTILASAASPRGHATCCCEDPATCPHDRAYLSDTAQWCYDAAHERYVFGDRYYTLSLHTDHRDLPLLTSMPGGNESDFTLSLKALDDLLKLIRERHLPLTLDIWVGDGHHDTVSHYQYSQARRLRLVAPLTKTDATATFPHPPPPKTHPDLRFDEDGTPLCPGGKRLKRLGGVTRKFRQVYVCPANPARRKGGTYHHVFCPDQCPRGVNCHPQTNLGFCVTLKVDGDPRLYPPIPRDSAQFKALYTERTTTERSNSVDDSYNLDHRCRNAAYGLFRLTLVNICKLAVSRRLAQEQTASADARFDEAMQTVMAAAPTPEPAP